jgi:hypothetical protein
MHVAGESWRRWARAHKGMPASAFEDVRGGASLLHTCARRHTLVWPCWASACSGPPCCGRHTERSARHGAAPRRIQHDPRQCTQCIDFAQAPLHVAGESWRRWARAHKGMPASAFEDVRGGASLLRTCATRHTLVWPCWASACSGPPCCGRHTERSAWPTYPTRPRSAAEHTVQRMCASSTARGGRVVAQMGASPQGHAG